MAIMKGHQRLILKRLKQQVHRLQRKEELNRQKLSKAIQKINELGRDYEAKVRLIHAKAHKTQELNYAKIITRFERRMLKSVNQKRKALAAALAKLEKMLLKK